MSIELYTRTMCYIYISLFFLSALAGMIAILCSLRKKTLKYGWLIPCIMFYSFFATINTFVPSIAYDDISDPNFSRYEGWQLPNFILNDVKMLLFWLLFGALLYFLFKRKERQTSKKSGGGILLIIGAVLFVVITIFLGITYE